MTSRRLQVLDLGRRPYREVLALQRALREACIEGSLTDDLLLLVEHEPVYTLGRSTKTTSLPEDIASLRAGGADVVEIERGGDVTWHGPGQLVGYPILHLSQHREDLHWYLRALESVLIRTLADVGLISSRVIGQTGVWIDQRKVASLGVHVRKWVTLHGFALNVQPDLQWFAAIVPCGIAGVTMTSIAHELGSSASAETRWTTTQQSIIHYMAEAFNLNPVFENADMSWCAVSTATETCDSVAKRPPFMSYG